MTSLKIVSCFFGVHYACFTRHSSTEAENVSLCPAHLPPDVHGASRTAGQSLAGNPPLALLLHPVLEHPVAVEHHALVAGGRDGCDLNTLNMIFKML